MSGFEIRQVGPFKALCLLGFYGVYRLYDFAVARNRYSLSHRGKGKSDRRQVSVAMVVDIQHVNVHPL